MSRLIITTVGTSIFQNYFKTKLHEKKTFNDYIRNYSIRDYQDDSIIVALKEQIIEYCQNNFPANIRDTSAEIQSLYQMKKEKFNEKSLINPSQDKLVLLHSDTLDGKIAADILYDFFKNDNKLLFSNMDEPVLMKDIRGDNANSFLTGLGNLKTILENLIKPEYKMVYFNITGGYKGVIPAITYYCIKSLKSKSILCYLYEETDKIVQFKIDEKDDFIVQINNERNIIGKMNISQISV